MAVETGTGSALVVAVIAVGMGLTAFGLWGAALAVRETSTLGIETLNDSGDDPTDIPVAPTRAL
jgi:hypothetical protein